MAASSANPFDSLYVTETIDAESFVSVFSPFIVHDTSSLFEAGNVVLVGTQGSGKSMLLSLLKPETRIAYCKAGESLPLQAARARRFIGGGVNLTRSGAIDFGQRPLMHGEDDANAAAAYFGDFLNYWIVDDLLRSLLALLKYPEAAAEAGMLKVDQARLDSFAATLSSEDCWLGVTNEISTFDGFLRLSRSRVTDYRNYFNYNTDDLTASIRESKTSAGEPISVTAKLLRSHGLVDETTNIFIRIDQYEELGRLDEWHDSQYGSTFASVVHKMLGLRDPRVSYRIGTRRNAWPERPRMQGTSAVLEELRNYRIVDLDEILRPSEHSRPFPKFAEDVFRRRITWAGYPDAASGRSLVREAFGPSPKPEQRAELYVGSRGAAPRTSPEWSPEARNLVKAAAKRSPLEGVLAEAYLHQQGEEGLREAKSVEPWSTRQWWRKERTGQALLQLAARQKQKMLWWGAEDIFALSGANILVFVSLCQSIWDAHLRAMDTPEPAKVLPEIRDPYIQDEGIQQASRYWHRKVRSDPDGDSRLLFVDYLGTRFRKWLRDDIRLSYPGHNGFSLDDSELRADEEVRDFLNSAAAYGVLVDRIHSTRNRGGQKRHKWYLAPIYSAYFQIPAAHVKEPRYVRAKEVRRWLADAGVPGFITTGNGSRGPQRDDQQESLFAEPEAD